jgi:hypothetical protein
MRYKDYWEFCFRNSAYNFQLKDNCLIQFSFKGTNVSYSYLGCPYNCLSYEDFVIDQEFDYDEVGDGLNDEYMLYISQCDVVESPNMIRYDLDSSSYIEGRHPAAHLHVGLNNHIRICIIKKLDLVAFVFFVLRQNYPDIWHNFIRDATNHPIVSKHKVGLTVVERKYFNQMDEWEFYLV